MKKILIGVISVILAFVVIRAIGLIMALVFKFLVVVIIAASIYFSILWMSRKDQ